MGHVLKVKRKHFAPPHVHCLPLSLSYIGGTRDIRIVFPRVWIYAPVATELWMDDISSVYYTLVQRTRQKKENIYSMSGHIDGSDYHGISSVIKVSSHHTPIYGNKLEPCQSWWLSIFKRRLGGDMRDAEFPKSPIPSSRTP